MILNSLLPLLMALMLTSTLRAEDPVQADIPSRAYLFSYFVKEKDGLHLAWSADGLKWNPFMDGDKERIFLTPDAGNDKIMRDPCILLGPDNVFRMVWTDSWHDQSIGYASSKDLIHWTQQQTLPVMKGEPGSRNTWAPEVHYDPTTRKYLIFWSSTIPGRFPETDHSGDTGLNHRIYLTTTEDFQTFTPTRLFFDPSFSAIDATILPFRDKFLMIFKNETLNPVPAKNLYLAASELMMGPYTDISGPIDTQPPHWVEGPTAIMIGEQMVIYYDCYREHHYGACGSKDLKQWTDLTPRLSMPKGARHGTVIGVPGNVVENLLKFSATASPAELRRESTEKGAH